MTMRSEARLRRRTTFVRLLFTTSILALSLVDEAAAQAESTPRDSSVPLPTVTIESRRAAPRQRPVVRRAPARRPAPVVVQAPREPVVEPPAGIQPTLESATGPVQGYVATRSSTGTKTNTPLIETPESISVVARD
jgi:iron complex outermembrane recepter protein